MEDIGWYLLEFFSVWEYDIVYEILIDFFEFDNVIDYSCDLVMGNIE